MFVKCVGDYAPSAFALLAKTARRADIRIESYGNVVDIICSNRIIRISKCNAVYIPQLIDNFEYYYESVENVVCRVRNSLFDLVDFSSPRLHYVREFHDFPLLCPGLIEPFKTARQYLDFAGLRPGQVVIDLGAYSGLTSIAFAREVGSTGRVIAVEPDPLTLAACKVNLARAGHSNIALVEKAVSSSTGRVLFSSEGALGSAFASLVGAHRGTVAEVDTITLSELIEQQQLERVDFIKMDVEGAEAWVLQGCTELLKRYRPKILIEPHLIAGKSTAPSLRMFLENLDYRCEFIEQYESRTLPLLAATP
jgi:FkbM family methyltransferase